MCCLSYHKNDKDMTLLKTDRNLLPIGFFVFISFIFVVENKHNEKLVLIAKQNSKKMLCP